MRTSPQERVLLDRLSAIATLEGGPMREGRPERWWQDPTWRCVNFHVAKTFTEQRRRHECVFRFCTSRVQLTFPEDRSGSLGSPPGIRTHS